MSEIAEDRVRNQLAKIVASAEFQNSERLCRFLQYTVAALLCGEQDRIKEYPIGKDVFDRDGDYDPRLDPIVRVEARRLRKKLGEYYAGTGAGDPIRIEMPKGSYVPAIVTVAGQKPSRRGMVLGVAGVLSAAAAAAVAIRFWPASPEAMIAVLPARWIWPGEDFPAIRHDEDLAERIIANLANRYHAPVIAWPSTQRFRGRSFTTRELANELNAARVVIVAVRVEADGFRATAYLLDPKVEKKLRVSDKRALSLATPEQREKVAQGMAAEFSMEAIAVGSKS